MEALLCYTTFMFNLLLFSLLNHQCDVFEFHLHRRQTFIAIMKLLIRNFQAHSYPLYLFCKMDTAFFGALDPSKDFNAFDQGSRNNKRSLQWNETTGYHSISSKQFFQWYTRSHLEFGVFYNKHCCEVLVSCSDKERNWIQHHLN